MKQEEYFKTIVVYGKMVNIGVDDYGQQYFLEYINEDGQLVEIGCGAYNYDYEDMAKTMIDYDKYSREIYGDELWEQMKKEKEERLKKYREYKEYKEKEKLNGTNI